MQHIDMHRITDIFGDDKVATQQFMTSVMVNTQNILSEIDALLIQKEWSALKDSFHRLKGSAANCGLIELNRLAKLGEEKILQQDWAAAEVIQKEMIQEFALIKTEIESMQ